MECWAAGYNYDQYQEYVRGIGHVLNFKKEPYEELCSNMDIALAFIKSKT